MKKDDCIIAYKVVGYGTRMGTNWTLLTKGITPSTPKLIKEWVREHPEYYPRYSKSQVIKEAPNSIGLMCFSTKEHAEYFVDLNTNFGLSGIRFRILEVQIKKSDLKDNVLIISDCIANPWDMKDYRGAVNYNSFVRNPPDGTIFCKKLKVLN